MESLVENIEDGEGQLETVEPRNDKETEEDFNKKVSDWVLASEEELKDLRARSEEENIDKALNESQPIIKNIEDISEGLEDSEQISMYATMNSDEDEDVDELENVYINVLSEEYRFTNLESKHKAKRTATVMKAAPSFESANGNIINGHRGSTVEFIGTRTNWRSGSAACNYRPNSGAGRGVKTEERRSADHVRRHGGGSTRSLTFLTSRGSSTRTCTPLSGSTRRQHVEHQDDEDEPNTEFATCTLPSELIFTNDSKITITEGPTEDEEGDCADKNGKDIPQETKTRRIGFKDDIQTVGVSWIDELEDERQGTRTDTMKDDDGGTLRAESRSTAIFSR